MLTEKPLAKILLGLGGTLRLPTLLECKPDPNLSDDQYPGVYPEFFFGFYSSAYPYYGLDCGIIYKNGVFRLAISGMADGPAKTVNIPNNWTSVAVSGIAKGDSVDLKAYFSNGNVVGEVWKNGSKKATITAPMVSSAYARLGNGSKVNVEMVIATNENSFYPSAAVFSDTKFSRCTLTTTAGSYVALTTSNSVVVEPYTDQHTAIPSGFKYGRIMGQMESGYVSDTASADCRP